MNTSIYSFLAWAAFMVAMLIGLVLASRRGRSRERETEDVASRALPAIGRVAEITHTRRFGDLPMQKNREKSGSWYPPSKHRTVKHG